MRSVTLSLAVLVSVSVEPAEAEVSFQGLGQLPDSLAHAISADGVDATQQANASGRAAEPTAEAMDLKPDQQTPAGEVAWGEAVDGVQVRLRAKQLKWKQGTVVRLWADIRNQGKRNLAVRTRDFGCELEVDGRWYCWPFYRAITPPPRPLPPGRRYDDIAVDLGPSWELAASQIARSPRKDRPKHLGKLTPGRHTVRVAYLMAAAENASGSPFKAVSNPVEIEIVAKNDEKVDATQQANASTTAAEPTVEATGAKPDDPTTAVCPVELSRKGGRPDVDMALEKEAVFDMEEVVPGSEPKLRDMIPPSLTQAVARKGEIEMGGRKYTALLAQLGTTTESFDRPETVLLLTPADNPNRWIPSYEKHLGAIRTVDGKYYRISATPTGDKLTVTPCGDNVGVLRVGAGDRDVGKPEVTGGVLLSNEALVPLGDFYYPVPAKDPAERRIPVGDYAPEILWVDFGNVFLGLRPKGPPAFDIKIRKGKPFTLSFSSKGNLLLTSPGSTRTFKPGSTVPLVAVIVDPQLNLRVNAWDATQQVGKRTYTFAGKEFPTPRCSISLDPTVVIRDASGKQVAEATMPYC